VVRGLVGPVSFLVELTRVMEAKTPVVLHAVDGSAFGAGVVQEAWADYVVIVVGFKRFTIQTHMIVGMEETAG
jgi:hypothetical protein